MPKVLPRIEDSLDCLNGATIFTSLNLQLGYWQVEMTEDSKPLDSLYSWTVRIL